MMMMMKMSMLPDILVISNNIQATRDTWAPRVNTFLDDQKTAWI